MTQAPGILRFLTLWGALAVAQVSRGAEDVRTEITVGEGPEREVRFASRGTVHVEGLVDGRWIGRSWNARAGGERSARHPPEPAFRIGVQEEPAAKAISLETGWQWVSAGEVNEEPASGLLLIEAME